MADEAGTPAAEVNPLSMSDEDFMKLMSPGTAEVTEEVEDAGAQADQSANPPEAVAAEAAAAGETVVEPAADTPAADTPPAAAAQPDSATPPVEPPAAAEGAEATPKAEAPAAEAAPIDYKAAYEKLMAPIKANGKTIDLRNPDELVALAQMGANYTRKMQDIAPHRKLLTMLQQHSITEDRLSFLIDLDKKHPEAIKKLLKDGGIDPLELDISAEPAYLGGNHQVSDEEVNFTAALDELGSSEEGQSTLQTINAWDQASKKELWEHPEAMATIHAHRESGKTSPLGSVYDRVAREVDRRRTLGQLPPGTSFLQAYKTVGVELTDAGAFNDLAQAQGQAPVAPAAQPAPPQPVATRVVAPKAKVTNDDQASAAASSRGAPAPTKEQINPLAMSDDEFLKAFAGRL